MEYQYLIYFIIFLILIHYVLRHLFFHYITKIDKKGKYKDSTDFYNSYFLESYSKNERQLINNVAFLRNGIFSSVYDGDVKVLELNKLRNGDFILSLNNNDCNFEIYLMQKILEMGKNIRIIICKTNLFEIEKCSNLIKDLGFEGNMETIYIDDINKISNKLWTIRAKDKFGDYGIIGILSITINKRSAKLEDFILSCRVVGRDIEKVMIEFIKDYCLKAKIEKIKGRYLKTKKNGLIFECFKKLGLIDEGDYLFEIISNFKKFDLSNIRVIKK